MFRLTPKHSTCHNDERILPPHAWAGHVDGGKALLYHKRKNSKFAPVEKPTYLYVSQVFASAIGKTGIK